MENRNKKKGFKLLWKCTEEEELNDGEQPHQRGPSWLELITVRLINSLLFSLSDKTLSSLSWINCVSLLTVRTADLWMKHWAFDNALSSLIIVSFLRQEGEVERFPGEDFIFLWRYSLENNKDVFVCVRAFAGKTAAEWGKRKGTRLYSHFLSGLMW